MTKLIVTPIDPKAPGSYRLRQRLLAIVAKQQRAQQSGDAVGMVEVTQELDALVLPRLRTDNGLSVESALDELPAEDFDRLVAAMFGVTEQVPPTSASSSPSSPEGAEETPPSG